MRGLLDRFREADPDCACEARLDDGVLLVDADECPAGGDLTAAPACRRTVVGALRDRDADALRVRRRGAEHRYRDAPVALFVAAGRFVERAAFHDDRLADYALSDPLAAAFDAAGRAGPLADVAAACGLVAAADAVGAYDDLRAFVGPTLAHARVDPSPPPDATLRETYALRTGATVRRYATPDGVGTYHLEPVERSFDAAGYALLDRARAVLADGSVGDGPRAPLRAVRRAAGSVDDPPAALADHAAVLAKHTRGYGVLDDLFADDRVSDVFASAPVDETCLRVAADGERRRTNVRLTGPGAAALASRFREASGRPFSRASPALDATAAGVGGDRRIRVAGVTGPLSDGFGFALRAEPADAWTLARLVAVGTLTPAVAALLSLSVERACACLVAGTRGAGKTTLLGALLRELPAATRLVVMEDTPELPVASLRADGRDVQALRTRTGSETAEVSPADALRTALRLGEGAIAVGEVRGDEARVLYEAMRVGSNGSAVLGTIHGSGGEAVRERVVSDLGVPASSFGATDLVVTLRPVPDGKRVTRVEEVTDGGFAPLFVREDGALAATGRLDRGNSELLVGLARPGETYADLRGTLADRAERFRRCDAPDADAPETDESDARGA